MSVRQATREDVPAIREIYNEAILASIGTAEYEPVTLEARLKWFDDRVAGGFPVLVFDDGEVRGFAVLSPWVAREGYRFTVENGVYVADQARGRGVGSALLGGLVSAARERGYRNIVARVAVENEASLRIHLRHGFFEVGRMPEVFFKFGRWYDLVLMQLRI